jgi:hypothetical protein
MLAMLKYGKSTKTFYGQWRISLDNFPFLQREKDILHCPKLFSCLPKSGSGKVMWRLLQEAESRGG